MEKNNKCLFRTSGNFLIMKSLKIICVWFKLFYYWVLNKIWSTCCVSPIFTVTHITASNLVLFIFPLKILCNFQTMLCWSSRNNGVMVCPVSSHLHGPFDCVHLPSNTSQYNNGLNEKLETLQCSASVLYLFGLFYCFIQNLYLNLKIWKLAFSPLKLPTKSLLFPSPHVYFTSLPPPLP